MAQPLVFGVLFSASSRYLGQWLTLKPVPIPAARKHLSVPPERFLQARCTGFEAYPHDLHWHLSAFSAFWILLHGSGKALRDGTAREEAVYKGPSITKQATTGPGLLARAIAEVEWMERRIGCRKPEPPLGTEAGVELPSESEAPRAAPPPGVSLVAVRSTSVLMKAWEAEEVVLIQWEEEAGRRRLRWVNAGGVSSREPSGHSGSWMAATGCTLPGHMACILE